MGQLKQLALKPQDLVVILKVAMHEDELRTIAQISEQLFIAPSQIHASIKRSELSHLMSRVNGKLTVNKSALYEFLIYGLKHVFPAVVGAMTRGVPTGISGPALKSKFNQNGTPIVWPDPKGSARGESLSPLCPTVPRACKQDEKLYEVLSLVDALRFGSAREKELAEKVLHSYL